MHFNTQKGLIDVPEILLLLALAAIIYALVAPVPESSDTTMANTMVNVCVAEVTDDTEWLTYTSVELYNKAMAFTPPAGIDIDEPILQNTREACFDRLVTAAAEAARSTGGAHEQR